MRLVSIAIASAISTVTLLFAASAASAGPFDRLWVFGDSTVDTGWYNFLPSGESQFDQYLSTYNLARPPHIPPTYGIGKATSSPGPLSVEVLATLIGTDVLPADSPPRLTLADPGLSEQRARIPLPVLTGTNYATGGSRNHDPNTAGSGLFPNAVPTEIQIANYLSQHTPDGQALYVISSGGNDVSYALNSDGNGDQTSYLSGVADSLARAIATLQQRGARYIIVTNLPESFGTTDQKNYRHLYNSELASKLTALGVSYAWADMNSLRQQIVANPASFGIVHTTNSATDRACSNPEAALGITSSWAYLCSPISPVSKPMSETVSDQSLFADDEHWATGGHRILGTYYFCLAERTWPGLFFPFGHIPPVAVLPPPCGKSIVARAP